MKTLAMLTFALGLVACGGSSGGKDPGPVDLSGPHTEPSGDLASKAGTDMAEAQAGTAGCRATVTCENACITKGGGNSAIMTCMMGCDAMETSSGTQLENTLKTCVETACPTQPEDMGTTAACAYDPSTDELINQMGCAQCQMTAQSMAGSCYSANQACNADM